MKSYGQVCRIALSLSSVVVWSVIWSLAVNWRTSDRVSVSSLVPSINRTKTFFEVESSIVMLSEIRTIRVTVMESSVKSEFVKNRLATMTVVMLSSIVILSEIGTRRFTVMESSVVA